ncbi:arylamine N-acetyltransferase, pineal gland isozyme NAT-3-like [Mixophyes fleayi]|uniref:arylamine N-acetyltransferase, pineal gland isozyme NAT-3-like n=1 Tax=Mixophyes fleayi TaxID=3061075 RepID=UPI003F4E2569
MDLNLYLQRVGITELTPDSSTPSLSALRELHRHHVLSVPFESLSIHSGEKIILDTNWIYEKIVLRKRGGFCCENNGLFLWVLQELGYQPLVLSARVRDTTSGVYGPSFDHMILTVELEGRRWLCDVGFGEGIVDPFRLETGWEEEQDSGVFRLRVEGKQWYLERMDDDVWRSLYKFTLEERRFEDFREMCEYHQTSPCSLLVCKSLCSLLVPGGRLTYLGHRLISTEYTKGGGSVKTTQELTEDEIPGQLREKFGIVLNRKLVPKDEMLAPWSDEDSIISG